MENTFEKLTKMLLAKIKTSKVNEITAKVT